MIANAVRGRPPEPARKLQVWRPAAGAWNSQRVNELRAGRGALELHPLAHGGDVAAADAGGRAEAVPAGAAAGGAGRRGAGVRGTGHDRVLPLSAGKIATADVMDCYWCDWSDAPDRMGGCYRPVTFRAPDAAGTRGRYCPGVLRIGLTGGIGSGKSTVSRLLAGHGAVIVDADAIAREVVEPGTPGLAAVVEAFGRGVLAADGSLDRPALAAVVFADPEARARLDAIVHPLVSGAARATAERSSPDGRSPTPARARPSSSSPTSRCSWRDRPGGPAYDLGAGRGGRSRDPGRGSSSAG